MRYQILRWILSEESTLMEDL